MSNSSIPESQLARESEESFDDLLFQYEKSHSGQPQAGGKQIEGNVIAVSSESVFLDIGFKTEGILPLSAFGSAGDTVKPA